MCLCFVATRRMMLYLSVCFCIWSVVVFVCLLFVHITNFCVYFIVKRDYGLFGYCAYITVNINKCEESRAVRVERTVMLGRVSGPHKGYHSKYCWDRDLSHKSFIPQQTKILFRKKSLIQSVCFILLSIILLAGLIIVCRNANNWQSSLKIK